jgi:acetyltransferase-like isoleucine patch superfamily enzyme
MKIGKFVNLIRYIAGLPKSIYVNLRLLPLNQAILLPIIVSRKTKLQSLSGRVYLGQVRTGIIRIGFGGNNMLDYRYQRTLLDIEGSIRFEGKCKIGLGSRIMASGELILGHNFLMSGDGLIICSKKITIGNDTMQAWESIIMDTDQHDIYDQEDNRINENREITIGSNVWIGARSFILKGVHIEDGCIIGANTTITKSFNTDKAVIAGSPAKIVRSNIRWQR